MIKSMQKLNNIISIRKNAICQPEWKVDFTAKNNQLLFFDQFPMDSIKTML